MPFEKVIVDAEALRRFREASGQLEVCDAQGRTLGFFMPPSMVHAYEELGYAWARAQFADDAELERARAEPGGLTTAEAIERLEEVIRANRSASEDAA
jgi:hypothetical protein